MVDPPSSSAAPRGPLDRESTEADPRPIIEAEQKAAAIIADAEIEAEQRAQRILSEAQGRLDAVLNEERASRARLARALDDLGETIERLEQGDLTMAPAKVEVTAPDPEPESIEASSETADPPMDEAAPEPVDAPTPASRSMFPGAANPERELIDTIKAALLRQINAAGPTSD